MGVIDTLVEVFRDDDRPAFIIDSFRNDVKTFVRYCNPAGAAVVHTVTGNPMTSDESIQELGRVIGSIIPSDTTYLNFFGLKWRVISLIEEITVVQQTEDSAVSPKAYHSTVAIEPFLAKSGLNKGIAPPACPEENLRTDTKAFSIRIAAQAQMQRPTILFEEDINNLPIGYAIFDLDGTSRSANQAYVKLLGSTSIDFRLGILGEAVIIGGMERLAQQFALVPSMKCPEPFEIKVKQPWIDHAPYASLLITCGHRASDCGGRTVLLICVTDTSDHKVLRDSGGNTPVEAFESKHQTENLGEVVLHELKNPLSAILQSADSILDAVRDQRQDDKASS